MKMSQLVAGRAVVQPLQAPSTSPDGSTAQTPGSREREEPADCAAPSALWFLSHWSRMGPAAAHSHHVPSLSPGVTAPSSRHPHPACSVLWGLSCFPWYSRNPQNPSPVDTLSHARALAAPAQQLHSPTAYGSDTGVMLFQSSPAPTQFSCSPRESHSAAQAEVSVPSSEKSSAPRQRLGSWNHPCCSPTPSLTGDSCHIAPSASTATPACRLTGFPELRAWDPVSVALGSNGCTKDRSSWQDPQQTRHYSLCLHSHPHPTA